MPTLRGSRKYIYPPQGWSLEILRGMGSQKHKFLKESMKLHWKSQGVGGSKPKNHPQGRYGYFFGITPCGTKPVLQKKLDPLT